MMGESGMELFDEQAASASAGGAFTLSDVRAVNDQFKRTYREHPVAVRLNAASQAALGLLMLFAVAAVFASDPRARRAVMLAAWAGIAFQFADVAFKLLVVRKGWVAAGPLLVNLFARKNAAVRALGPSALISWHDVTDVSLGLLGVLFSLVILTYFGGKRGRSFFGVGPRADMVRRQPHHGG
jgi:hypothetical protein